MRKKALIIGITGQDGSYLAEFLLARGYEVHGLIRRSSSFNTSRIEHLYRDRHEKNNLLFLHYGDLSDASRLAFLIEDLRPEEIYNLGAQSHVKVSFELPEYTGDITGLGSARLLEAIRMMSPSSKYYQASSSEMFGASPPPQSETTPFYPRSPYGVAKVYSYWITKNYREAYGIFAVNGILFNHESPRRGETFVSRKITVAAARIKKNLQTKLYLGNLDAVRDWGYAPEYVEGMWMMLQQDVPRDYVLATGEGISVKKFLEVAFDSLDLNWKDWVEIDESYLRPSEVDSLVGDASLAMKYLGWKPSINSTELASLMAQADLEALNFGPGWIDKPKFRDDHDSSR